MHNENLEKIRRSCKLAAETLVYIEPFLVAGILTSELDSLMDSFIRKNNGIPASLGYPHCKLKDAPYPSATCISVNDIVCHGIPGDYSIKNGDIVSIDVATILDGFFGDTCFTFYVGEISNKVKKFLKVAKSCLYVGINQARPGAFIGDIGYEIDTYTQRNGFTVCEAFQGHGTGEAFHLPPDIKHKADKGSGEKIVEGMIFTIEPIICQKSSAIKILDDKWSAATVDGRLAAQYEHTILVGKNGVEILTDSSIWL